MILGNPSLYLQPVCFLSFVFSKTIAQCFSIQIYKQLYKLDFI